MRKLALTIATMLSGGIVLFLLLSSPQPTYQGRTITAWQDEWARQHQGWIINGEIQRKMGETYIYERGSTPGYPGYYEAVQHLGTNALPYAVRNLALNDSSWRGNYGWLWAHMPGLLHYVFRPPKPLLGDIDGANVFFQIGSNSIPYTIALLKHDSRTVRRAAASALGALRCQSPAAEQAIPALIEALSDTDGWVRFFAASALQQMGPAASNAVPALNQMVACTGPGPKTNHTFLIRGAAAVALGKIGPAATNALPVLQAALHESNARFRAQSAVAIWRLSGNVDTTLPVLLHEMPVSSEGDKWDRGEHPME